MNPLHLSWKTRKENSADKLRDGTDNNGERHGGVKVSTVDIDKIRERYAAGGNTQRQLAAEYGVGQPHISHIVNGKRRGRS